MIFVPKPQKKCNNLTSFNNYISIYDIYTNLNSYFS